MRNIIAATVAALMLGTFASPALAVDELPRPPEQPQPPAAHTVCISAEQAASLTDVFVEYGIDTSTRGDRVCMSAAAADSISDYLHPRTPPTTCTPTVVVDTSAVDELKVQLARTNAELTAKRARIVKLRAQLRELRHNR